MASGSNGSEQHWQIVSAFTSLPSREVSPIARNENATFGFHGAGHVPVGSWPARLPSPQPPAERRSRASGVRNFRHSSRLERQVIDFRDAVHGLRTVPLLI